ncbi:MAG: methylmalonyl-CoA epimerase [Thermoanaerobaculaceae bacterium]
MKRVHHIGVAVANLAQAVEGYKALGLKVEKVEEVVSEGVRVAFLPVGETMIELLEPLDPGSPVARFLAKRGPGLHHICFEVADLEAAIAQARQGGLNFVGEAPRRGAQDSKVCFIHPQSLFGVLVELWQDNHA